MQLPRVSIDLDWTFDDHTPGNRSADGPDRAVKGEYAASPQGDEPDGPDSEASSAAHGTPIYTV